MNAASPSPRSSELITSVSNQRVSFSIPFASGSSSPSTIALLAACTALGAFWAIVWARSRAARSSWPAGTVLLTRPIFNASAAEIIAPVKISSFAFAIPTSRGKR